MTQKTNMQHAGLQQDNKQAMRVLQLQLVNGVNAYTALANYALTIASNAFQLIGNVENNESIKDVAYNFAPQIFADSNPVRVYNVDIFYNQVQAIRNQFGE